MKKTDLSYKLRKLLEPCKYWEDGRKKEFMPIVEHAAKLEEQVRQLEAEVRRLSQTDMLTEAPAPRRAPTTGPVLSRNQRIWKMIHEGQQDSEEFQLMLKWSRLTPAQVMEIYEQENVKIPVGQE